MRPQTLYDPKQTFYALTAFKYAGVDYKRGDKFDIGEMPNRKRIQFFQNWYIGYTTDFRDNKASIKEVPYEKEDEVKKEDEVEQESSTKEEKVEEEKPKTRRTNSRRKKSYQSKED